MLTQHRFRSVFEPSLIRPSRLLAELQNDFSDLFQAVAPTPDLRTWASDEQAVLEVDAPGIQPEQVDLAIENDELTLTIPAVQVEETGGRDYLVRERRCGSRRQQFRLPFPVDAGRTDAVYENGVLRVTVHRREESKPAKIAVRAGA